MDYRRRQGIAMRLAPLMTMLVLAIVFYRPDQPISRQLYVRPLVAIGMLALVFGPVLIGNYLAGRKGKPPLS
jgi:hypothetical protein